MSPTRDSPGMRLACDECHVRKLRCSRNSTACARCIRNGIECLYSPARKVGRKRKAEKLAMKDAAEHAKGQRKQTLESRGADEDAHSSPPPCDENTSHAAFWAELGDGGFDPPSLQGLWNVPHLPMDEAGFGDGSTRYDYDTAAMAIGADAFPHGDIWGHQSHSTPPAYSQIPSRFAPTPSPNGKGDRMGSAILFASSAPCFGPHEGAPSEAVYGNIQRLSKLQQELFTHRTRMSDAEDFRGEEAVDIDAVIGVGQAILDLTRSLFACFTTSAPQAGNGRSDGRDDPARILLALTPSLLVVTTYNDILDLISRALHDPTDFQPRRNMQMSGSADFPPTTDERAARAPRVQPRYHGGLYENLDFPVRLIVSMTVIDYQLGPLYRSLQLIRSKHSQRQGVEGIDTSRDMLTPSIEGLWSATQGLRERVGKLIGEAKLVDTH